MLWRLSVVARSGFGLSFRESLTRDNSPVWGWWHVRELRAYKSALYCLLARINAHLLRWVRNKYRRLRGHKKAQKAWIGVTQRYPRFFAHWAWVNTCPPLPEDQDDKSRVTGDCYARICGSRRVRPPPVTRQDYTYLVATRTMTKLRIQDR